MREDAAAYARATTLRRRCARRDSFARASPTRSTRALARLVRELATDVLARELRLSPCDLAALARRIAQTRPSSAFAWRPKMRRATVDLPTVVDRALRPGDAIVELSGGELDARLGVRLATVLERTA